MSALSRVPKYYDVKFLTELVHRIDQLERVSASKNKDIIIGLPDAIQARGVAAPRLLLVSPNGTIYQVKVDNAGVITTVAT